MTNNPYKDNDELKERLAQGDPEAVQWVYDRCVQIASYHLSSWDELRDDIEDVVQEIMIKILVAARSGAITGNCMAFIAKVITHFCYDLKRALRIKRNISRMLSEWDSMPDGRDPDDEQKMRKIEAAIGELSEKDRRLVAELLMHDSSPAAIARALDLDVNVVNTRLHRMRKRLQPILDKFGIHVRIKDK